MKKFFFLTLISCALLSGCSNQASHPALSSDGYGFVEKGPVVPPPPELIKPVKTGNF